MALIWRPSVEIPDLKEGQLHVWKSHLSHAITFDEATLSSDERFRMQRFRFDKDRRMFLLARGLLRRLLGAYLKVIPGQIKFCYTDHGKPYVFLKEQHDQIEFNISHSGDIVCMAFVQEAPVGIDVEDILSLPDLDQVASRFFSPGEQLDLNKLSGTEKVAAFYRCWTRKEAVIKACGEGLSMPLDSFQVSLLPGEPARLLNNPDKRSWLLLDLSPEPGYAAAVAAPMQSLQVECFSTSLI